MQHMLNVYNSAGTVLNTSPALFHFILLAHSYTAGTVPNQNTSRHLFNVFVAAVDLIILNFMREGLQLSPIYR